MNADELQYSIDVSGLEKSFGNRKVVQDLSLKVAPGQIYGFLGPNGSGKTTTIRMLCGLITPDAGNGTCLGYDIRRESHLIKKRVGYMTQKFTLYTDLTVKENLQFIARIYGLPEPRAIAADTMSKLGLSSRSDQLVGELSGGWKQRLALSACILPEPQLLLLDEPTAGVDPKARREFWNEIHGLASEGLTVLVSTHYMDEAERCHEIAYISHGRILIRGAVDRVKAEAGITTWIASGASLYPLQESLGRDPRVDTVAMFGSSLHVSGRDPHALLSAITPLFSLEGVNWQQIEPNLEDVFIHLMNDSNASGMGREL